MNRISARLCALALGAVLLAALPAAAVAGGNGGNGGNSGKGSDAGTNLQHQWHGLRDQVQGDDSSQKVPTGVRRVGAVQSATANINGRDRRVNVDVAILDTGIADHADLNVRGGVNCSYDPGKNWKDENGHGTHIAGAVGAIDNDYGVVGVAPGARLWSVKVLGKDDGAELSNIVCGLDWVTAHADTIKVAVMAFGDVGSDDGACGRTDGDLLHQAVCRARAAGVTLVAAAGNNMEDSAQAIPAAYSEVMAVSWFSDLDGRAGALSNKLCDGISADDTLDPYSGFGAAIDIAAPGDCVRTTDIGNRYRKVSSAGISAGYVAGGAALYLSTHRWASPQAVQQALVAAASEAPLTGDPDQWHEALLNVASL